MVVPQHSRLGEMGLIRPTETQIRTNTFVIPKRTSIRNRQKLRWFHGFDVIIDGVRFTDRKLDLENRIGGLALRTWATHGDLLRLEIIDGVLMIHKAEEQQNATDESPMFSVE